jgi:hypothetical protein
MDMAWAKKFWVVVLVVLISASLSFALEITVPSAPVQLKSWGDPYEYRNHYKWQSYSGSNYGYYSGGGFHRNYEGRNRVVGQNYYELPVYIYYRVLIHPDGTEEIIDQFKFDSSKATSSIRTDCVQYTYSFNPYYSSWGSGYSGGYSENRRSGCSDHQYFSEYILPEKTIEVNDLGDYKVEIRYVEIPRLTHEKFPNAKINDFVDLWVGKKVAHQAYYTDRGQSVSRFSSYWYTQQETIYASKTSPEEYKETGKFEIVMKRNNRQGHWGSDYYEYDGQTYEVHSLGCKFDYERNWEFHSQHFSGSRWGSNYNENYHQGYNKFCWLELKEQSDVKLIDLVQVIPEKFEFEVTKPPEDLGVSQSPFQHKPGEEPGKQEGGLAGAAGKQAPLGGIGLAIAGAGALAGAAGIKIKKNGFALLTKRYGEELKKRKIQEQKNAEIRKMKEQTTEMSHQRKAGFKGHPILSFAAWKAIFLPKKKQVVATKKTTKTYTRINSDVLVKKEKDAKKLKIMQAGFGGPLLDIYLNIIEKISNEATGEHIENSILGFVKGTNLRKGAKGLFSNIKKKVINTFRNKKVNKVLNKSWAFMPIVSNTVTFLNGKKTVQEFIIETPIDVGYGYVGYKTIQKTPKAGKVAGWISAGFAVVDGLTIYSESELGKAWMTDNMQTYYKMRGLSTRANSFGDAGAKAELKELYHHYDDELASAYKYLENRANIHLPFVSDITGDLGEYARAANFDPWNWESDYQIYKTDYEAILKAVSS